MNLSIKDSLVSLDGNPFAGICRVGNDDSLLVENWVRMYASNFVFLNPPFYSPKFIGKEAQVFRLKTQVEAEPEIPGSELLANLREDRTFVFDGNAATKSLRNKIRDSKSVQETCQNPELHRIANIKRIGSTYDFAMGVIFGTYVRPNYIPYWDMDSERMFAMFESCFDITTTPEKGDLVLYYHANPNQEPPINPTHYGVYKGNNMVLSKFRYGAVFVHPAWLVDACEDADFIRFLRMKEAPEITLPKVQAAYQAVKVKEFQAATLMFK